jgi:hypothetical protein
MRPFLLLILAAVLAAPARAQLFLDDKVAIPQGVPFNNSDTENVDFGDVDGDGDWDAVFADGGDFGNDQNRIWINQGGAQGGTLGTFIDQTALRFPAILDTSRDVEFADIDADGDLDLCISNVSTLMNQTSRWWINTGGNQGGSAGFYVDETQTRWVNLGINNGSTIVSSLPAFQVLPSGGFFDWNSDSDFGDLDNDGDLDLVHSSYGGSVGGQAPTRLFLNDGSGAFEEFNPSKFQLTGVNIQNGNPGLWCEGLQAHATNNTTGLLCDIADTPIDIDLGDIDGDFDLELLHGARNEDPRMFRNRLEESGGTLAFRDVTHAVFPPSWAPGDGAYEQEMGDLDGDDALDIYGLNWFSTFSDLTLRNNGDGTFGSLKIVPMSSADEEEADFFDYDLDGDLDVIAANFSGSDRLYRNDSTAAGIVLVPQFALLQPSAFTSRDADCCDVDDDGDYDAFVANAHGQRNLYYRNTLGASDAAAPRIASVEQAPDRAPGPEPTVIRASVYDNTPYYITWYDHVELHFRLNGGPLRRVPMRSSAGQVFRAELPGTLAGWVAYHVRAADRYGNESVSSTLTYVACGETAVYCTAKVNSLGCTPAIAITGTPSAYAASGCVIAASRVINNKSGVLLYGLDGRAALPFQNGTLCVQPGVRRAAEVSSGGSPPPAKDCSGVFALDFNAWNAGVFGGNPAPELSVPGTVVNVQWWGRDPGFPAPNDTTLSDALEFTMCL